MSHLSLGRRGYVVKKENLTEQDIKKIERDLTFQPIINQAFRDLTKPKKFCTYLESKLRYYLPRYYGLSNFGPPVENKLVTSGQDVDFEVFWGLKDYQLNAWKKLEEVFIDKKAGGVLSLPCGLGKTFLSIRLGGVLKKKMLVLVNKEVLLRQWREAIEKCSNASVGIIQRDKIDVKDRDIVIAMLHSVSMKDYPDNLFDDFGYCVIDECHHISSETFSKALPKIACQYMLGLSATPIRKDGLTDVFLNYLGPIIHKERRTNNNQVWIKYLEIDSTSEAFDTEIMQWTGTKDTGKMTTNIAGFESVNRLVIEICRIMVQCPNFNRKILVLGSRREQLEWLNATWKSEAYDNYDGRIATGGLYYGNIRMNKKEYWNMLEESAKCDVIWGTSEIAKEGLDIPDLNTLIMLNGGSDVEQAVGRILRKYHETTPPTVIDMVYKCGNFQRHANVRRDYYESEEYTLQKATISIDDDPASIKQSTAILEKYLNSYPPNNDKSILKPRAKAKKNTEIPLGNHPTQLASISVGDSGGSAGSGSDPVNGKKSNKTELKSIPVEKLSTAKKPVEGKWEGEFDSDDERDLLEHGLEHGHLCLLDSDDEKITADSHNLIVRVPMDDNMSIGDSVGMTEGIPVGMGDSVSTGDNVSVGDNEKLENENDTKIGNKVDKFRHIEGIKIAPKIKFRNIVEGDVTNVTKISRNVSGAGGSKGSIEVSSNIVPIAMKNKPAIAVNNDVAVPIVRSGGVKRNIKSIPTV
jgi:superfamily II DNA or RNA helicase/predicted RecA/RadA family phage recombinase